MDAKRNFLEAALAVGLECELIRPADVLRHLTADILASHLPGDSKTKLLRASLEAGKMDAELVFEALEARVFAEHMPKHRLWACIAEAAQKALDDDYTSTKSVSASKSAASKLSSAGKAAGSKTSSIFSDGKSRRRPNVSRRPARLTQPRQRKATADTEGDNGAGGASTSTSANTAPVSGANPGSPTSRWTAVNPIRDGDSQSTEQPFNEWVEETVTGDAADPRKRQS
ncbi:MAG: hypothetical protein MJE77_47385 [Proteobacteria bacterium]|nr:hypothetical protein [Pseudomonadota bacterium]